MKKFTQNESLINEIDRIESTLFYEKWSHILSGMHAKMRADIGVATKTDQSMELSLDSKTFSESE